MPPPDHSVALYVSMVAGDVVFGISHSALDVAIDLSSAKKQGATTICLRNTAMPHHTWPGYSP